MDNFGMPTNVFIFFLKQLGSPFLSLPNSVNPIVYFR